MSQFNRSIPALVSLINAVGRGSNVEYFNPVFAELPEGEIAEKVVCSAALTVILSKSGRVYCLGSNNYGQCGFDSESLHAWNPARVLGLERVRAVDIAAGYQHVLVSTENGTVYGWGKGERGQLGTGAMNFKRAEPIPLPKNARIRSVGAGFNHSTALTHDGQVFVWGKVLGEDARDQRVPRALKLRAPVVDMISSQFHTMMRTVNDEMYLVGRQKSHLKIEGDYHVHVRAAVLTQPKRIELKSLKVGDIRTLCRGIDSTHFITHSGQVYTWDWEDGTRPVQEIEDFNVYAYETGYDSHLFVADLP